MDTNHRARRGDFYACRYRRADAIFTLAEALLAAGAVPSPVHLSGEPSHRRGWGSRYAALVHGRIDETGLEALLAAQPLAAGQPVYAVDCSVWSRCDAAASPERGFYYHPTRHSAGRPGVVGWSHQWLPRSASPASAGPRRSMCATSTRTRTPTRSRSSRSRGWSAACRPTAPCRWSSATRACRPMRVHPGAAALRSVSLRRPVRRAAAPSGRATHVAATPSAASDSESAGEALAQEPAWSRVTDDWGYRLG